MKRFVRFFMWTLVMLAMSQAAWAVGTFSVVGNYDSSTKVTTFRITRTAGTSVTETVYYRTVSLGAIDGQHFTAMSGSLTFDAEHNTRSIEVEEKTPSTNAYKYQTTGRSYRFEVLDVNGFELAGVTRNLSTSGTQITSANAFAVKDVTVKSGTITVKDENYAQAYYAVPVATYFSNAAPQNYLVTAGAELRMTLTFSAAEKDDGYQHLQILVNHPAQEGVTNWDEGAGDNQPGTMNYSSYMATFCHKGGSTYTTYADYSFPVTSLSDWTYNSNNKQYAWTSLGNTVGDLRNQQFNTNCRADDDGRLVISTKSNLSSFSTVGIRFDASGDNEDTWYAQNTIAHIQAVDGTNPTLFNSSTNGIIVSAGPYVKGSTFYVSVPFSEIIKVTGTPTLTNNWGTLSYTSGSGSNVLTFKGTITNNLGSALKVSGLSGTVTDLAGNSFTWPGSTKTFSTAVSSPTYTLAIANTEFTGLDDEYVLSDNGPIEPHPTIYFYKGKMTEANRVTLAETTDYTLAWADNTSAGTGTVTASGTGNYTGSTSTTFPIRWATYTLRLHHNDGTDDYTDMAMTYNTAANIQTISRTGYTFDRWTTGADGSGTTYTDRQEVLNLTATDGEVIDLYAQWTAHTYTVRFNRNEGTGTMSNMTFTYGVAQNLTANTFTRTGCIFDGWNTAADGTGDSYADEEEVINLTPNVNGVINLYAQWNDLWGVKNGANGNQTKPYLITTTAGLDLLASDVNSGTDYDGKYFKLDADIAYDPNTLDANGENYTAIGGHDGSIIRRFNGTFDGDGHTVSGIRINKTGTNISDGYQGLFGALGDKGTVQNVILNDARITGWNQVGGITGSLYSYSTIISIKNCWVLNTDIITSEEARNVGVISGYTSGTTTANYYYNCSLTQGGTTSTTNIGAGLSDRDGARSVHTLTLPTDVTATGESVTISGTTYYVSAYRVTLTYSYTATTPEGYVFDGFDVKDANDNDVTVTESSGTYTFTMPASDVTVSSLLTDVWGIAGGANGSQTKPYIITTTAGLDLLATRVNSGINEYGGTYFKLGADIAYTYTTDWDDDTSTENNYTAIGHSDKAFCGIFDGDGHTISGIRIYQPNTYRGLFGRVWAGTVKNVILTDTRITGWQYVGGISGQINGGATIQDCLVLNTAIQSIITDYYTGVVIGSIVNGTLSNNHYHGCTVNGTANAVNVGTDGGDRNGARSVHTLTLPTDVTATGENVTISGATYYASNTTVTLNYEGTVPDGKTAVFIGTCSNGDVVKTANTFQMPAADVTVSVAMGEAYALTLPDDVSATGVTTTIDDNEYFLSGTIVTLTYTGTLDIGLSPAYSMNGTPIEGNTFEMPAADVTVSVTFADVWGIAGGANGSKTNPYIITTPEGLQLLSTYTDDTYGMYFQLGADIDMSGVTDFTPIGWNYSFEGSFDGDGHTISHLTIDRGDNNGVGLFGYIYEGSVCNLTLDNATITGYYNVGGIAGDGWFASITNCHVISSVIRGYYDVGAIAGYLYVYYFDQCGGGNTYHSTLIYGDTDNSDYHDGGDAFNIGVGKLDINGNEIYGNVEGRIELDAMKLILSDGRDNSDLIAAYTDPYNHLAYYDYYYDDVPYVRDLEVTLRGRTLWKDGGWNTLCLPFNLESLTGTPLEGATVKTLSNSSFDNGTLTLNFTEATSIVAGQPYIVKWAEGNHLVNPVFTNKAITNTLTNSETDIIDFIGTYDPVDFGTEENRTVLLMGANNNLFYPDGTASSYVNAFRGYFQLHDGYVCGEPTGSGNGIKEFIVNFDDTATGISLNPNPSPNGEGSEEWFTLDGRRLSGKPNAKGIYIVNGKKVFIK